MHNSLYLRGQVLFLQAPHPSPLRPPMTATTISTAVPMIPDFPGMSFPGVNALTALAPLELRPGCMGQCGYGCPLLWPTMCAVGCFHVARH